MIKNDNQLSRTVERLLQIQASIKDLEKKYEGPELEFWAGTLRDEATKLKDEINEYNLLRLLPFNNAVENILQKPILLENVGELLAKLRIAAKLTQAEMAERLGWQQSNLSRFENENYNSQTIAKISEYLGNLGVWLYVKPSLVEDKPLINYTPVINQTVESEPVPPTFGRPSTYSNTSSAPSQDTSLENELFGLCCRNVEITDTTSERI